MGALAGPLPELWLGFGAELAVAALTCSLMLVLVGRWAIIPTWLLFVVLGNTSSGGAVAPPLLPPFYAFVGWFLPPGATVDIIRGAVYFRHQQRPRSVCGPGCVAHLHAGRAADLRPAAPKAADGTAARSADTRITGPARPEPSGHRSRCRTTIAARVTAASGQAAKTTHDPVMVGR